MTCMILVRPQKFNPTLQYICGEGKREIREFENYNKALVFIAEQPEQEVPMKYQIVELEI